MVRAAPDNYFFTAAEVEKDICLWTNDFGERFVALAPLPFEHHGHGAIGMDECCVVPQPSPPQPPQPPPPPAPPPFRDDFPDSCEVYVSDFATALHYQLGNADSELAHARYNPSAMNTTLAVSFIRPYMQNVLSDILYGIIADGEQAAAREQYANWSTEVREFARNEWLAYLEAAEDVSDDLMRNLLDNLLDCREGSLIGRSREVR